MSDLRFFAVISLLVAVAAGCWGPIDKGQPGVRNRVTPQGQGAEWIKLQTDIEGKSPVASAPAHGSEAAPAAH